MFNWSLQEVKDMNFEEVLDLDGENWMMDENRVFIGTKSNGFSSMHLRIETVEGQVYFVLPMIRLAVMKVKSEKPKKFKASKKKSSSSASEEVIYKEPMFRDVDEEEVVPFKMVDQPPLGPECKRSWEKEEQRKCLSDFIVHHVQRKFNTDLSSGMGAGTIRIDISFIIDKEGNVINPVATGATEVLNAHALEVISSLPTLRPATHKGEKVMIAYQMPILFQVVD